MFALANTVDRLREEHFRMVGESMRALDRPLEIEEDEISPFADSMLPPGISSRGKAAFISELRAGRVRFMGHAVLVRNGDQLTVEERKSLAASLTHSLKVLVG